MVTESGGSTSCTNSYWPHIKFNSFPYSLFMIMWPVKEFDRQLALRIISYVSLSVY
jgi:hypothetical protein